MYRRENREMFTFKIYIYGFIGVQGIQHFPFFLKVYPVSLQWYKPGSHMLQIQVCLVAADLILIAKLFVGSWYIWHIKSITARFQAF